MEILDVTWFTLPTGMLIGIVLGEDQVTKERKAYIGIGEGTNEEADTEMIAKHGAKISKGSLQRIVARMGK